MITKKKSLVFTAYMEYTLWEHSCMYICILYGTITFHYGNAEHQIYVHGGVDVRAEIIPYRQFDQIGYSVGQFPELARIDAVRGEDKCQQRPEAADGVQRRRRHGRATTRVRMKAKIASFGCFYAKQAKKKNNKNE